MAKKIMITLFQLLLIILITSVGNLLQQFLHLPIAGSIIGLVLFYILLMTGVVKETWIKSGANLFLTTMIFFFLPSIVGVKNIIGQMDSNFVIFFLLIAFGTVTVAYLSGYIAEKSINRIKGRVQDVSH
ncbi:CidA/LrgA family protein [Macrococcus epidermidis]|uniref:CidA/LrgA family protein n=1 Tax=Macrococcus epidermidis TaxID=1902580 RepID=A0A327ZQQ0_9STAP|nr:CidA/LrgA family protein [Macrococcus epidermidis]MCG7419177.1 CidA/LrgA family protein [Macrococcus epidermidis]RAK44631.1 CidA/LrgA family protein [Macrococcus epidermidis]UTH16329.1 CidA/LrgA family protein [Macrococcus epidermidis]